MSGERKVVWTQGMFLRPPHFQQHALIWAGDAEYDCADSCYFYLSKNVYLWELS